MFPQSFWPASFWPASFWPKIGGEIPSLGPLVCLELALLDGSDLAAVLLGSDIDALFLTSDLTLTITEIC